MVGPKTKLQLERYSETVDGMGGFSETWSGVCSINGSLLGATGRENIVRNKATVTASHNFFISTPFNTTITEKDRLVLGTRVFDILYVEKPANTQRFIILRLQEQS